MVTSIVIVAAKRTALGSFQGALARVPAPKLGAAAIRGALASAGISSTEVSDVFMGNVLQAGLGQAPARQAALYAELPPTVRTTTIHRVCGSGMEAILQGVRALTLGQASIVVAGGMENMSSAPYLLSKAREGLRLGHQQLTDSLIHDGLWDPYNDRHMGSCAEECARKYAFSREDQDHYASESFRRSNAALASGRFREEIVPVEVPGAKGAPLIVDQDEGPLKVVYDRIPALKPAFEKTGTITAANASTFNDGAAAVVLMTAAAAQERQLRPIGRIVSAGSHAQDPLWFTTAPVVAAKTALSQAGWSPADVDLWEVNEAFAVVPLAFARELGVALDQLNVRGGAISLGHPIGASGARIVVTLLHAMRERGAKRGLAAICIGGGEGLALCVEQV